MDIETYLARMDYHDAVRADLKTLRALHRNHMLTIPFENLDIIPLHHLIQLSMQSLWDKIIVNKRGGFCYELNGMFAWLLKEIGFEVTYLNGRVFNREGKLGIEFDHLALLVYVPGESARLSRWLADVGFGDSFTDPLNVEERSEQVQGLRAYRLEETSDGYIVWKKDYDGTWSREYFFDLQPRNFPNDYEAGCLYHQTSPKSSFTRGSIVSKATLDGRVTLEENKLIITKNGQREERAIENEEHYRNLLKGLFKITL